MNEIQTRIIEEIEYIKIAKLAKKINVIPESYCLKEYEILLNMNTIYVGSFKNDDLIATQGFIHRTKSTAIIVDYMSNDPASGLYTTLRILDKLIEIMIERDILCFFVFASNDRLIKMYQYLGFIKVNNLNFVSFLPFIKNKFNLEISSKDRISGIRIGSVIKYVFKSYIIVFNFETMEAIIYEKKSLNVLMKEVMPSDLLLANNIENICIKKQIINKNIFCNLDSGEIIINNYFIIYPPLVRKGIHSCFVTQCNDFFPYEYIDKINDHSWRIIYRNNLVISEIIIKKIKHQCYNLIFLKSDSELSHRVHFSIPIKKNLKKIFIEYDTLSNYHIDNENYQVFFTEVSNEISLIVNLEDNNGTYI